MNHTLISPNQVRAYRVSLCDDPIDSHHSLGIEIENICFSFVMSATTFNFTTRTPTGWELENCPLLEVTSDAEWNPKEPHFPQDPGDTCKCCCQSYKAQEAQHQTK